MLSPSPGALLSLALLMGAPETAEPPRLPDCAATPRVELAAVSAQQVPEVCVSPGEPTTFFFDSLLAPDAVEFQPEGRLADWSQGRRRLSLTVIPKGNLLPGERLKVTVRFADGAAPSSASFWLVVHAAKGARRVEVFRHSRPADALEKEAAEARAEARQCQEEKGRLLAEREAPGGVMGIAWVERERGAKSKNVRKGLKPHPGSALKTVTAQSYSHPGSMALRLQLANPGAEPWTAAGALLKDATGAEVELSVWQKEAIAPGASGHVVMGAMGEAEQLGCPCTLTLWEAQGPRTVTLGNVIFPDEKQGAVRK